MLMHSSDLGNLQGLAHKDHSDKVHLDLEEFKGIVSELWNGLAGVTDADLQGKPAGFATPNVLVRLASQADKVLVY